MVPAMNNRIAEFQREEVAKAIARGAPLFMGLPDEWYEPFPEYGCDNGRVHGR
jgi:hypothetical protein